MRQIRPLLDLVVNFIFSPTDTQYYLIKVKVTVRGYALMQTGSAQLDDDPKAITAGERDARNIHLTNINSLDWFLFLVLKTFDPRELLLFVLPLLGLQIH